jgi:penicillin-binding protein 2
VVKQNISAIKVRQHKLDGSEIHFVESRNYLYPEAASHVIGYIGPVSNPTEKDKEKYGQLYLHPDFRIGKAGIEKSREDTLAGSPGYKQVEVNASGKIIKELDNKPFVSGKEVKSTLDIDLQNMAKQLMTGKGGLLTEGASAVMIDVKNGDVLVMCSVPGFDPHSFISGISNDEWKKITENPDKPLINKSISSQYPPGSTFKPFVALAALAEGVIDPNEEIFCPGHMPFGNRTFHCWKKEGHGPVNLNTAIAQSCNVYFYTIANRLKIDNLAKYAKLMGFGTKTNVELPSEKNGLMPDSAWKRKALKQPWYDGETLSIGIGQGYTLATPLQIAVATARIASGGRKVDPRLIIDDEDYDYEFPIIPGINPQHVKLIQNGMAAVVNAPYGTAYRMRNIEPNLMFAGKTGTVQIKGNKKNVFVKDLPTIRAERHHGMFTGFGPVGNPRFAVAVVVEHGGFGAQSAAPIGKELLTAAMKKYGA